MKFRIVLLLLLASLTVALSSCAHADSEQPETGVTTLIYAQLSKDGADRDAINKFNRAHDDVQIEVRNYNYLSENGKGGIDLLLTEIAAGKIPDIIELGTDDQTCQLPYQRMAQRGYLEDLWPYIENDPEIGRENIMEAPLKAVEVNGGLYTIFDSVYVHTLTGSAEVVGDRTSWTMQDMMDAFASLPEGAVLLDDTGTPDLYCTALPSMKEYLLSCLMYCSIDMLVDWDTGECFFDGPQFRNILEFVNMIPDRYAWRDECKTRWDGADMVLHLCRTNQVLLEQTGFRRMYGMREKDFAFNGRAACVGYPVEDGSVGSYFEPAGIKLAMSTVCKDKDAAWEYMRQALIKKKVPQGLSMADITVYEGVPVSKKAYLANLYAEAYNKRYGIVVGGEYRLIDRMTKERVEEVNAFFDSITRCSIFLEKDILDIVEYEASIYFAGDLTLEQVMDRIQSRVQLYVDEQR